MIHMSFKFRAISNYFFSIEPQERLKVLLLTISFFLVIGSYTITRELKDVAFVRLVAGAGRSYQAWAKILAMVVLVPAIFFHSRLVDVLRRHYLLYFYTIAYGIVGLCFVYYMGHPTIGLGNTIAHSSRIFGWLFYLFIEGFVPFVVSVFWAFANSITSPVAAKKNYTVMIAGSKLGGIIAAFFACTLLNHALFSDVINHQILLGISSCALLIVPIFIAILVKKVPPHALHGYEAGYQIQEERHKQQEGTSTSLLKSMTSGLLLLFKYPYVMGIFGMSFFFELISQAFKIENIVFGVNTAKSLSGFTSFLLMQAMFVHLAGFFVVVFGTRALIQALGEKRCLVLVPTLTGISVLYFIWAKSAFAATVAFVVTRSINYAFATPLRESLYIPTIKEIQFKSKSWIEGFGAKFAKTCAVNFNAVTDVLSEVARLTAQSVFFSATIGLWVITAYLLGKRFEKAVKRNEVIGSEETATG